MNLSKAYFNPRSSCEERPNWTQNMRRKWHISIHAPHARSDLTQRPSDSSARKFQSTLLMRGATEWAKFTGDIKKFQSTLLMRGATGDADAASAAIIFQSTLLMRGATDAAGWCDDWAHISIHAPHARSDKPKPPPRAPPRHFNPRSSCEERLHFYLFVILYIIFQSTLLMRGATSPKAPGSIVSSFQSTLLMRGATRGRPRQRAT